MTGLRADPYNATQVANAKTAYHFWLGKGCDSNHAYSWVGDIEGECSLLTGKKGDYTPGSWGNFGRNATTFGICQWKLVRVNELIQKCGIDVRVASFGVQLEAAYWEITEGWYKHVWPIFQSAQTIHDQISVLVKDYESTKNKDADIVDRVAHTQYWVNRKL